MVVRRKETRLRRNWMASIGNLGLVDVGRS